MGAAGGIGDCIDTIVVVGVVNKEATLVYPGIEALVAASMLVTGVLFRT